MQLDKIPQKQKALNCDLYMEQYDDKILFYPVLPCVEKELTITVKSLNMNKLFRHKEKLFAAVKLPVNGEHIGVTYQGFTQRIIRAVVRAGKSFFHLVDKRIATSKPGGSFPKPRLDLMHGFRFSQQQLLTDALLRDSSGLIGAPTRYGKCLGLDELCLKYNYTVVKAADVKDGDLLMGPDGLPRKVTGCIRGEDPFYKVKPITGDPFECNEDHVLSLRVYRGKSYTTVNITVKDYLNSSEEFKSSARLYYAPLKFAHKELEIPPYKVGHALIKQNGKSIPLIYLTASATQRTNLLGGIYSAAHAECEGDGIRLRITHESMAFDIVRLCLGLGIPAHKYRDSGGEYYWVYIDSPYPSQDQGVMRQFSVEPLGVKPYAGFELEGPDKLFLLWDHLVTHNTTLMINTLRAYPTLNTCVIAPGLDLVKQLYEDITGPRGVAGRDVQLVTSSRKVRPMLPGGITVCSIDSAHRIDPGEIDLVLADEPHALVASTRLPLIDSFPKARRIGFGATLEGRFDGRDSLIEGVFGSVLAERTYKEAVDEGAICPLHILFLKVEISPYPCKDRRRAYNRTLFHSSKAAALARAITQDVIPPEFQTMIFVKDEKQADLLADAIGKDSVIAMAKRMSTKERSECDKLMKANVIKRCLCTKIYVQGVTFSDVRVLLNMEAGGNNTSAIQKPGRLAEIRPGKKCGIVIDLLFVPPGDLWQGYNRETNAWLSLCQDSRARRQAYEDKGYDITVVNNLDELKTKFNELI